MKRIFLISLIFVIIMNFSGCSDSEVTKRLTNADFAKAVGANSAETVYTRSVDNDIFGLDKDGKWKLVLVNYNDDAGRSRYSICAADYDNMQIIMFEYGDYAPLEVLYDEHIISFPHKLQSDNVDIIYEYISKYGFYCFEDVGVAENYIMRLTKNDEFIPLNDARDSISKYISAKEPMLDIYSEINIIFKDNSAVPLYYACRSNTSGRYMWSAIDRNFEDVSGTEFENYYELENFLIGDNKDEEREDKEENRNDEPENSDMPVVTDPDKGDAVPVEGKAFYRVRKSAYDADSQIGAFSVLENAKNLALSRKSEGYKVYDTDGNLIYAP
ncbi:MAG: hypothetical protein II998_00345 [Clostridia bacterium]|nr:hypothetical protein [Clostridia bacterium]